MAEYLKIPGGIDPHVHFRTPGATHKENFETGTKAAVAGGFTKVIDMPNTTPPTTQAEELVQKVVETSRQGIYSDVGFHLAVRTESLPFRESSRDFVFGGKLYMDHTTTDKFVEDEAELQTLFGAWPKNKPLIVHAEGASLEKALRLTEQHGNRLHVAHVSLAEEVEMIRKAKSSGLRVTSEVTPHHLFLTNRDTVSQTPYGLMKPPLATSRDQDELWEGIKDGTINMVATDHAPHTREEKDNLNPPPFGVPGLETSLLSMLHAVSEKRLTMEKLVELMHTNPAEIFQIGTESPAYTFVELDLNGKTTIDNDALLTRAGWSPFAGFTFNARIAGVTLRGVKIYNGQEIMGKPQGKVIIPY